MDDELDQIINLLNENTTANEKSNQKSLAGKSVLEQNTICTNNEQVP